jgi:hypothetical protein
VSTTLLKRRRWDTMRAHDSCIMIAMLVLRSACQRALEVVDLISMHEVWYRDVTSWGRVRQCVPRPLPSLALRR